MRQSIENVNPHLFHVAFLEKESNINEGNLISTALQKMLMFVKFGNNDARKKCTWIFCLCRLTTCCVLRHLHRYLLPSILCCVEATYVGKYVYNNYILTMIQQISFARNTDNVDPTRSSATMLSISPPRSQQKCTAASTLRPPVRCSASSDQFWLSPSLAIWESKFIRTKWLPLTTKAWTNVGVTPEYKPCNTFVSQSFLATWTPVLQATCALRLFFEKVSTGWPWIPAFMQSKGNKINQGNGNWYYC